MTVEFKTAGHERVKEQLAKAMGNGKLGHAYLFSGEAGTGKFALALEFAAAYLCESENKPCGTCGSCVKIKKYVNPNFQYVFPLNVDKKLRKDDDFTQDGWEYVNQKTVERIENPHSPITDYYAPVYVHRIRYTTDIISHRRGQKTATIIEGIDTLSDISLNTMLKTLEEPPAGALIILLARKEVLPTVRSRCIVYKFSSPDNLGIALQDGGEAQRLTAEFTEIVFKEKSDFARMMRLEKFTNNLSKGYKWNFDLAQQILTFFTAQIRAGFLCAADFEREKPSVYIPNFKDFEQASLCGEAIDKSMLSIKRNSPLTMVFADLTIKLTGIFNE